MSKTIAETRTSAPNARPSLENGETRPRLLPSERRSEEAAWEGKMDAEPRRREEGGGDWGRPARGDEPSEGNWGTACDPDEQSRWAGWHRSYGGGSAASRDRHQQGVCHDQARRDVCGTEPPPVATAGPKDEMAPCRFLVGRSSNLLGSSCPSAAFVCPKIFPHARHPARVTST